MMEKFLSLSVKMKSENKRKKRENVKDYMNKSANNREHHTIDDGAALKNLWL